MVLGDGAVCYERGTPVNGLRRLLLNTLPQRAQAATLVLFSRISGRDVLTFGVFPGRESTLDRFPNACLMECRVLSGRFRRGPVHVPRRPLLNTLPHRAQPATLVLSSRISGRDDFWRVSRVRINFGQISECLLNGVPHRFRTISTRTCTWAPTTARGCSRSTSSSARISSLNVLPTPACICICIYICTYLHLFVFTFIYIFLYIYIYIYIERERERKDSWMLSLNELERENIIFERTPSTRTASERRGNNILHPTPYTLH